MSGFTQTGPLADPDIILLKEILVTSAAEIMVHGIYMTLVVIALYQLWTRKANLAGRNILITTIITMSSLSTAGLAAGVTSYLAQFPSFGFHSPDVGSLIRSLGLVINIFLRLNYLISDSIVVWRAWILWTNHVWVHGLLSLCLIGSLVGVSVDFAFGTEVLFGKAKVGGGARSLILTLPLFLTNFIVTVLVAYKVWEYRVEIKRNLEIEKKTTRVEKILILLTESGAIYCMLWIVTLVIDATKPSDSLASITVTALLPELTVLYPTIMILLVALEKVNLESTVTAPPFSQSIQFASVHQVTTGTGSDVVPNSTNTNTTSIPLDPGVENSLHPEDKMKKQQSVQSS
ncbi:hypothetical protein C8J56DRAFT_1062290 [Mycena floridula]|nr:hypothetical protein C8J56DRAFT_1062290 [Mycena floridula]